MRLMIGLAFYEANVEETVTSVLDVCDNFYRCLGLLIGYESNLVS